MAQTTGSLPQGKCQVEVSVNGSTWTDISGQVTSVALSGGEQLTGEQHTFDGQYPIVTGSGKMGAVTATFNFVYTETSSEAFDVVFTRFEDGGVGTIYVRYSPAGGQSSEFRYFATNDAGSAATAVPITACNPPDADAGVGDAIMASFAVIAPQFKQETIA